MDGDSGFSHLVFDLGIATVWARCKDPQTGNQIFVSREDYNRVQDTVERQFCGTCLFLLVFHFFFFHACVCIFLLVLQLFCLDLSFSAVTSSVQVVLEFSFYWDRSLCVMIVLFLFQWFCLYLVLWLLIL